MAGKTAAVRNILQEVEKVVSSIDYDDLDEDVEASDEANLISSNDENEGNEKGDPAKKRTWKKPKDKPKRPLSAYNIFFQLERGRIVTGNENQQVTVEDVTSVCIQHKGKKEKRRHRKTHGKISFADLARTIAARWKKLDKASRVIYDECAAGEKSRYRREVDDWIHMKIPLAAKMIESKAKGTKPVFSKPMATPPSLLVPSQLPMVTPSSSETMRQYDVAVASNLFQPQDPAPSSNSLQRLISQGRSYMHYQTLIEQQRQMIEEEMCNQVLASDARQRMLPHQQNGLHAVQPNQAPALFGSTSMQNLQSFQQEQEQAAYYNMAEKSFQMAQMTLPLAQQQLAQQQITQQQQLAQQRLAQQQIVQQQLTQQRLAQQQFVQQQLAQQHLAQQQLTNPLFGLGSLMQGAGLSRFNEPDSFFDPIVSPPRVQGNPTAPDALVILDPHNGLSSPTFDDVAETGDMTGNLFEAFESA